MSASLDTQRGMYTIFIPYAVSGKFPPPGSRKADYSWRTAGFCMCSLPGAARIAEWLLWLRLSWGSKKQSQNDRLVVEIKAIPAQTRETYGAKRYHNELAAKGLKVSLGLVRLRSRHNIYCKQTRKFKVTTNSN